MKQLPNDEILLEMLKDFILAEKAAREICELSTELALKYQRRLKEIKEAKLRQVNQKFKNI